MYFKCVSHLSDQYCYIFVFLSLRYGESQQKSVRDARERAQERNRRERQWEREEEREDEEGLPSDRVTCCVKTSEIQTVVTQHVNRDEQPQRVRHEAPGHGRGQQTEPVENIEENVRRQSTCGHGKSVEFILRVNHGAHNNHIRVKQSREHDQNQ